jgi:hypothetical protein
MGILKTYPVTKFIAGEKVTTSDVSVVTSSTYTTTGESAVIIKGEGNKVIILNSKTTDHITIKSLTDSVLIKTDKGLIDGEYEEIEIHKGACVELRCVFDEWYIMSSDGLKNS